MDKGEVADKQLDEAQAAAYAAHRAADWAACGAVDCANNSASDAAYFAAYWAACWDDRAADNDGTVERTWQVDTLIKMLEDES